MFQRIKVSINLQYINRVGNNLKVTHSDPQENMCGNAGRGMRLGWLVRTIFVVGKKTFANLARGNVITTFI